MRRQSADSGAITRSVRWRAWLYGALLTFLCLLGWTAVRLAYFHKVFGSEMVIDSLFGSELMQTGAGWAIGMHLVILFMFYLLFWSLLWRIADSWQRQKSSNARDYISGVLLLAFVGIYWALFTNAWVAPNSHYALLPVFQIPVINATVSISMAVVIIYLSRYYFAKAAGARRGNGLSLVRGGILVGLGEPVRRAQRIAPARVLAAVFAMGFMAFGGQQIGAGIFSDQNDISQAADQPNIILIGFDSLNVTGKKGRDAIAENMPALTRYLDDSTRFAVAYTTVGRTFPAWASVLTGLYPANNGVRANLQRVDPSRLNTIASWLRSEGYATTYATDERLFSNIDHQYGFDTLLGPEMGAADFLIGQFGDTPLSNLLVNTLVGRIVFPHLHANRHAYYSYHPETFSRLLERHISGSAASSGQFLALHFCLAHSPYLWGASLPASAERNDLPMMYRNALDGLDQQFAALMHSLESHGWLDDALVIVFSDHGEQLGAKYIDFAGSAPGEGTLRHKAALGHGSDLLSEEQSRILLATRGYGSIDSGPPGLRWQPAVTLVDIAPTVVAAVGRTGSPAFASDGISLLDADEREAAASSERTIFVETGLIVDALLAEKLELTKVARETLHWYEVSRDGRVQLKEDVFEMLVRRKQFGVYGRGHLLVTQRAGETDKEWFLSLAKGSPTRLGTDATVRQELRRELAGYAGGAVVESERVRMHETYRSTETRDNPQ